MTPCPYPRSAAGKVMNSRARVGVVNEVSDKAYEFGKKNKTEVHLSGLPLIRTELAIRISKEMKWFLAYGQAW